MESASLTLSPSKQYLILNRKPFFWLADTWWYGATNRMKWPEPFKSLVLDRKKKGFTVIQIVVGYPPEIDINSEDAKNGGGAPFNETGKINPRYFDETDKKIKYIVENGLIPCIVGGWGHHIDELGVEKIKKLWTEIIARYSHYPAVFCIAGEVDINFGLPISQDAQHILKQLYHALPESFRSVVRNVRTPRRNGRERFSLRERTEKWGKIAEFIKKKDRGRHLITAHVSTKDTADNLFDHPDWLSVNTIQSGHSKDSVEFMVEAVKNSKKMIIDMEPWYEG